MRDEQVLALAHNRLQRTYKKQIEGVLGIKLDDMEKSFYRYKN